MTKNTASDDSRGIIYAHNIFIVQALGIFSERMVMPTYQCACKDTDSPSGGGGARGGGGGGFVLVVVKEFFFIFSKLSGRGLSRIAVSVFSHFIVLTSPFTLLT